MWITYAVWSQTPVISPDKPKPMPIPCCPIPIAIAMPMPVSVPGPGPVPPWRVTLIMPAACFAPVAETARAIRDWANRSTLRSHWATAFAFSPRPIVRVRDAFAAKYAKCCVWVVTRISSILHCHRGNVGKPQRYHFSKQSNHARLVGSVASLIA